MVDPDKYRPRGPYIVLPTGEVVTYFDPRGNLEVAIQDQFTPAIAGRVGQVQGVSTVAVETAVDDLTVEVASAASASVGDRLVLTEPIAALGDFYIGTILGIAVNVLTLDTPINAIYGIGDPAVFRNSDLNVNGSVATELFDFPVGAGEVSLDITRVIITIECAAAPDDSKFGDLAALTNGIVFRKNGTDGLINYWNVKTNGDFAALAYDVTYTDKAGAGNHGVRCRISYGGIDKHGVVIRLAPNESLELLVQDNLSTLVKFVITIQGHVVED